MCKGNGTVQKTPIKLDTRPWLFFFVKGTSYRVKIRKLTARSGYFLYPAHVVVQFLLVLKTHILAYPLNVLFIGNRDGVIG